MNLNNVVGKAVIRVEVDTDDVDKELKGVVKDFGRAGDKAGDAFEDGVEDGMRGAASSGKGAGEKAGKGFTKGLGSKVKTGVNKAFVPALAALGGLAAGAWSSAQAASSLAESQGKVENVFGETAEGIKSWSLDGATTMGLSSAAAMDLAANFAALGKAAGLSGTDLNEFATSNTQLSADVASMYDVAGGAEEASISLGAALRGEAEPMRKYGVLISAAALQVEALEMGLIKANVSEAKVADQRNKAQKSVEAYAKSVETYGEDSTQAADALINLNLAEERLVKTLEGKVEPLSDQNRILAANSVVWKQTTDVQGDYARTSDGMANSTRSMSAEFDNAQAALGEGLMPIMTKGIQQLTSLSEWVKNNTSLIMPLVAAFGLLAAAIVAMKVFITLISFIKAATAAMAMMNITMGLFPLLLIVAAVVALIATLIYAYNNIEWFRDAVNAAFSFIGNIMETFWSLIKLGFKWLQENWPLVLAILTGPIGLAVYFIKENFDKIVGFFKELPGRLADIGKALVNALTWPWRTALNAIIGVMNHVIQLWNGMEFGIPSFTTPWGQEFGGMTIGTPDIGTLPSIPALAQGGVVKASPGGTLALIGEGGRDEAVVPLGRGGAAAGIGSTVTIETGAVVINGVKDAQEVEKKMKEVLANWSDSIGRGAIVGGF